MTAGVKALGLDYVTTEGHRLPQLHCIRIPSGIDDMTVRKRLLTEWGIEIGGGLGPFKGQAWRVGLMGQGARRSNVTLFLSALETCLRELGHKLSPARRSRRRRKPMDKPPRPRNETRRKRSIAVSAIGFKGSR